MPDLTQGPLRYLRGGVLGVSVGSIALVGHAAGHGTVALVPALLVVGLALAAAAALTGRVFRPALLAPFVVGFQLVAHKLLSPAGGHSPSSSQHHLGLDPTSGATGRVWAAHPRTELGGELGDAGTWWPQLDAAMVAGHAIAAVIIVVLMWRADAALASFIVALQRAIDVILGGGFWVSPGAVVAHASRLSVELSPAPSHELAHPCPTRRRGPPVPVAFC